MWNKKEMSQLDDTLTRVPLTLTFDLENSRSNYILGMGGSIVMERKGQESLGCSDVKHNHYVTPRQRILLLTGWLKMSAFPSTRLVISCLLIDQSQSTVPLKAVKLKRCGVLLWLGSCPSRLFVGTEHFFDCPATSETTLKCMGECIIWIQKNCWYNHDRTKRIEAMLIFHGT